MADIIKIHNTELAPSEEINERVLMEISDGLLFDARTQIIIRSQQHRHGRMQVHPFHREQHSFLVAGIFLLNIPMTLNIRLLTLLIL